MIKLLHAADLHLDSPFESLSAEKAAERRLEQRALLHRIVELCAEEQVDIVLFAGDLLDSTRSSYETSELLTSAFEKIDAEICIAPGNHDYYCSSSPYASLTFPSNVHIFSASQFEQFYFPKLNCTVWGAAFTAPYSPGLLSGFSLPNFDSLNLMVLHGDMNPSSQYCPISEDDIARSHLDYLALGHIHSCQLPARAGDTYYAYPGCPEGRGFDELGEKGVLLGSIDKGICDMRFIPICSRQYRILDIDLTEAADAADALRAAIPPSSDRDIYRVIFSGSYDKTITPSKIAEQFSDKFYSLTVRDRTRPRRDIWDGAGEDTLKGLFLSKLKKQYSDAKSEAERDQIVLAVRYGLAAFENGEEICL